MIQKILCNLLCIFIFGQGLAQDKPAYLIYNAKGKKSSYKKMLRSVQQADILLFGEYHNDPIAHWLQLELAKDIHKKHSLVLGAEMIETDNQEALDAYLKGEIDQIGLDTLARLWGNYNTDYAPLVNFAKQKKLSFIATNIPRRYARLLFRNGVEALDSLSMDDKKWICPLPFSFDVSLSSYQEMLEMAGGNENFPKAQAIKDATMAHFILKNYQKESKFIHYNGAFHSDDYQGILWYLKQERSFLRYATITMVLQDSIQKLLPENHQKADYIICIPSNMTRTH